MTRRTILMDTTSPSMPSLALSFRPLRRADFPLLSRWLAQPHVRRWWRHRSSLDAVEGDFGPSVDGADPTELFLALEEGRPVGLVQRYRLGDHPGWLETLKVVSAPADAVGIDYLIGEPDAIGRGLGTAMIGGFVGEIWRLYPAAPSVVVGVQQENPASWRVLEKVGFHRAWSGRLNSDDASDEGLSHVYEMTRP